MLILNREEGIERERETSVASCTHPSGTESATQTCVLTRNQTLDLWVLRRMLQPTEPHQPGLQLYLLNDSFFRDTY